MLIATPRNCWWSRRMPPMHISPWARPITSSEACRDTRGFCLALQESTATRKWGFNSSRSRPSAARPFAKIMLALAALREKKAEVARTQLEELVAEFPENPLFALELAKLKVPPAAVIPQ